MAGKPHNRHIKSQKPKKSRLSFTHVIPSVTVRPFSLSRVVFLHDLWQSAPILGTNGVNNHCFTGWCGGWCHHGSLLPPHVRTVLLLVEDEKSVAKNINIRSFTNRVTFGSMQVPYCKFESNKVLKILPVRRAKDSFKH